MVKPTEKRVYFTRDAQSEHKYVLALEPWLSCSKQSYRYSVTCNWNSESSMVQQVDPRLTDGYFRKFVILSSRKAGAISLLY